MNAEEVVRAMVEGKPLPEQTLYDLCWREYKDCLPEIVEIFRDEGNVWDGRQTVRVIFKVEGERYFLIYFEKMRGESRTIYTYPEQVAIEVEPITHSEVYFIAKEKT